MADRSARPVTTPLQRQLAGATTPRPTPLDAFQQARRTFLAGQRVDMQALAKALGVDRATLYRWVGSRDQLLSEVLWSLIEPTIGTLRAGYGSTGTPAAGGQSRAAAIMTETVRAVIGNTGMRAFIHREGDLALRLLTTKSSAFETRLTALIGEVLECEAAAGRLQATIPMDDLPYVLVRIMESYIYVSLITGEPPDPDRAARVINALLPAVAR
jgi:AcrR family transcriptional regulator